MVKTIQWFKFTKWLCNRTMIKRQTTIRYKSLIISSHIILTPSTIKTTWTSTVRKHKKQQTYHSLTSAFFIHIDTLWIWLREFHVVNVKTIITILYMVDEITMKSTKRRHPLHNLSWTFVPDNYLFFILKIVVKPLQRFLYNLIQAHFC